VLAREANETKNNPTSTMNKETNINRETKRGAILERERNHSTSTPKRDNPSIR
jgi:hypothetical protein